MAMESLEARVQRLEDIEEIRRLKIQYAMYCDDHYNPPGIASLFVENAVWDGGRVGRYVGRQAIHDFFATQDAAISFALHYTLGHQITIDPSGKTATGTWYIFMLATAKGQAFWLAGTYADEYVKVEGKWYFQNVNVQIRFMTPYEQSWVKKPSLD